MSLGGFVVRNALRNKRRLVLTVSSVAVSLFLLTLLQVVLRGLTDPATTDQAALRIVVRHKVSLANMLFAKYKERIERLPGVVHCSRMLWFGGIYQDERNFFPQFACDPDKVFQVFSEARIDREQLQAFVRERTACVVGIKTMERFGWKLGDRVNILGAMWPADLELNIRGVYSGGTDETYLFFHHAYADELLGDQGFTGLFWVKAADPSVVPGLIQQIDAEFANSDAETKTETERSFQLGFVSMLGNMRMLIASVSGVIVFTLILVAGGTMSMTVRERIREIGIMKALGFRASKVFGLVLAESLAVALAGGLIGCLAAALALSAVDFYKVSRGLFVNFHLTPDLLIQAAAVAALLGLGSCLLPAWSGVRRSVVEALRTTD
jgi:putative ABC transport system permease protein